MKIFLLFSEGDNYGEGYIVFEVVPGDTTPAYSLQDVGSDMKPVCWGSSIEELAEKLSRLDSDNSVGIRVKYEIYEIKILYDKDQQ